MSVKYNYIGQNYNRTRRADPFLTKQLHFFLQPNSFENFLDIGCGTGNYTNALHRMGLSISGIDPSNIMLDKANHQNSSINWFLGTAEDIPLPDRSIDGVSAFLTVHHWNDLNKAFKELNRILKKDGRMVVFTSSPGQMQEYWLNHYFPIMLKDSIQQMPSLESLIKSIEGTDLIISETHTYFIHDQLEDFFLYSGKNRPEIYLDSQVRQGISSFSSLAHSSEVNLGLFTLEQDIKTGEFLRIRNTYTDKLGDYLFLVLKKN